MISWNSPSSNLDFYSQMILFFVRTDGIRVVVDHPPDFFEAFKT